MNNTVEMRTIARRRMAPAWIVAICRFLVWLTSEETINNVKVIAAVGSVAITILVAGAMESGAVTLVKGTVICAVLLGTALFATRDM